jgi:hypothetical protein
VDNTENKGEDDKTVVTLDWDDLNKKNIPIPTDKELLIQIRDFENAISR